MSRFISITDVTSMAREVRNMACRLELIKFDEHVYGWSEGQRKAARLREAEVIREMRKVDPVKVLWRAAQERLLSR